jgi:hypothetical protein
MPDMTDEEADALDEYYTKNPHCPFSSFMLYLTQET